MYCIVLYCTAKNIQPEKDEENHTLSTFTRCRNHWC